MGREIKFRAWSIAKNDWVYGFLYIGDAGEPFIIEYNECVGDESEVVPGSVGQMVGLKDKNGVEIFEGDILVGDAVDEEGNKWKSVVEWKTTPYTAFFCFGTAPACHLAEVIGNIYQHPELIK